MKNKKGIKQLNKFFALFRLFGIKSLSVYQLTFILLVVASLISFVTVAVGWAFAESRRVQKEIAGLKENALAKQKENLKEEASSLINYLEYIQRDSIYHSTEELKEEAMIYFESIRFGNDGYVFVNTYDGLALLFDGHKIDTIKNISDLTDPSGLRIFQKELELAQIPEGGSFQYQFKKINDSILYPKMSYIMGFDNWGWIIGAGDYLDSVDIEIASLEKELESKLYNNFLIALIIFIPILFLLIFFSSIIAKAIQNQFNTFVRIIKRTDLSKKNKRPFELIFIRELKEIAYDIAQAEERVNQLGNIIDQSQNEIYIFNQDDLHFVLLNSGARKNCGYSKKELLKMTPLDLKPELSLEQFRDFTEPLKQNKKEQIQFETINQRKDKSFYPVDVHLAKSVYNEKPVYVAFIYDISIRKEAEKQMLISNQRFIEVFDNAPVSLWEEDFTDLVNYLDIQLELHNLPIDELFEKHPDILYQCAALVKVVNVNKQTLNLFEAENKEELYGNLNTVFTEDSVLTFKQSLFALYRGEKQFSSESENLTLKGEKLDVLLRWSFLSTDGNPARKIIVSITDLSDLRKTEQELYASEARFHSIFENSNTIMLIVNPENKHFIDVNPSALDFYGYSRKQFLNDITIDDINTLSSEEIKVQKEIEKSKKNAFFNFKHRLSNGEIRDVEVYSGELKYEQKTVLFSIVHDITEKKQAEDLLIKSKNKIESIFRAAPTGIGLVSDCVFTEINDRFCEMTGFSAEELLNQEARIIYPSQEEFERVEKEKYKQIREKGTGTVETKFKHKNGKIISVLMSSTPLDMNDLAKGVTFTALDITERNEIYQELEKHRNKLKELVSDRTAALEESQRGLLNLVDDLNSQSEKLAKSNKRLSEVNEELETFTYSVSHDLKAPLRGIDGYSQLLLEEFENEINPEANKFLNNIRKSTQQMNLLIEDLLGYSRMERKDFTAQEVEFRPLVDNLVYQMADSISERKGKVKVSVPKKFILHVDKDGLNLVLRNLIENALKFSVPGKIPHIEIGGSEDDEKWIIFVKDKGIGFDMKYHDRIFKIFQRLHLAEEYEGTGIGLAMVAKAVQRMNGKIWAESELGKGSCFYVEIEK